MPQKTTETVWNYDDGSLMLRPSCIDDGGIEIHTKSNTLHLTKEEVEQVVQSLPDALAAAKGTS